MSKPNTSASSVAPLNLTQQRKRAKELLKGVRAGEADAKRRVSQYLPDTPDSLQLAQAQWIVAREAGFQSWQRLKLHVTQAAQSPAELLETALSAAIAGDQLALDTALSLSPQLRRESIHLAAALADEAELVRRLNAADSAGLARTAAGSRNWSPLAYLCHARLGRERADVRAARARAASQLITAGADATECVDTLLTPGGKLSVLAAAAWHTTSAALVNVLLTHGALLEPEGATAGPPAPPLVAAAHGGNLECVERLLADKPRNWQAREALEVAVGANDAAMARALLAYGALPDHAGRWAGRNGGCLHAALLLERDVAFIELLLAGGATVASRDRDQRSPLAVAIQVHALDAAALLRKHGASDDELDARDHLLGACVFGDAAQVESLLAHEPNLVQRCRTSDVQLVCWAVRQGHGAALERLLELGFAASTLDDDGDSALHLAIKRRDVKSVEILVRYGASAKRRNYDNLTPLDYALSERDPDVRRALLACLAHSDSGSGSEPLITTGSEDAGQDDAEVDDFVSKLRTTEKRVAEAFEQAVLSMVAGDLEGLRALLDHEPTLVVARSPRYHRATLLHYLGSNGTEVRVIPKNAAEIARLLLERGAEVDASCNMYGGGPHQNTMGMVVTSGFPEEAGLTEALVDALMEGGSRANDSGGVNGCVEGAIFYGNEVALRALVKHGARAYDLGSAAAIGDIEYVERELGKLGQCGDASGATSLSLASALHNAARFGHFSLAQLLLDHGVDIDARDAGHGATALHWGGFSNRTNAVKWLLAHGADPTVLDRVHHGTPAGWAAHNGAQEALALLKQAEEARAQKERSP